MNETKEDKATADVADRLDGVVRCVRRSVLNMDIDMWRKLGPGDFTGTAAEFLTDIGLPGGLSALYSDSEREFFREIYEIARAKPDKITM